MTTPFGAIAAALGGFNEGREQRRERERQEALDKERREGTALARAAQLFREQAPEREAAQRREREGQLASLIERARGGDESAVAEVIAMRPDLANEFRAPEAETPEYRFENGQRIDVRANTAEPIAGYQGEAKSPARGTPEALAIITAETKAREAAGGGGSGPRGSFVPMVDSEGKTTFYNPTTGDQKAAPDGLMGAGGQRAVSENERRAGGLLIGADASLKEAQRLITDGYDPSKEGALSRGAATFGMSRTSTALASTKGKLFRNAVKRLLTNYLYTTSGATANPGEIVSQAEQTTTEWFDNPETIEQKMRFLEGKVEEMKVIAGRAAPQQNRRAGDLPASVDKAKYASDPKYKAWVDAQLSKTP